MFESRQIHKYDQWFGGIVQLGGRDVRNVEIGVQLSVSPLSWEMLVRLQRFHANQNAHAYGEAMWGLV